MRRSGFTLIEMVVVVGVLTTLLTIGLVSLPSLQYHSSLNSLADQLLADIQSQQLKAMTGDTDGSGVESAYGIYFLSDRYVLFRGTSYSSSDQDNFSVPLDPSVTLSASFPSSGAGSILVFSVGTGEISGYVSGQDTVSLTSASSAAKSLRFNHYGVLISQI